MYLGGNARTPVPTCISESVLLGGGVGVGATVAVAVAAHGVGTVDNERHVGEALVVVDIVEEAHVGAGGVVGAAHIHGGIGDAVQVESVAHHTHGCGVNDDEVVLLTEAFKQVLNRMRCEQLCGVGRYGASHHNRQVWHAVEGRYQSVERCLGVGQEGGKAGAIGQPEIVGQTRVANVAADEEHLLAQKSHGDSEVERYIRLAFAGACGCYHDDLVLGLEHEAKARAQCAEQL